MKNTLFVFAAVACLISVVPVQAQAQSPLAEAARREAQRREALRAATIPTYTNEDLAKLPQRTVLTTPKLGGTEVTTVGSVSSTPASQPITAGQAPGAAPAAGGVRDEKYWRDRITAARTNLSRAEIFAESLESRINALTTDIINRDDPAQRQRLTEQRAGALAELNRVKTEIVTFREQIAAIEEEARQLNVPPGWVR